MPDRVRIGADLVLASSDDALGDEWERIEGRQARGILAGRLHGLPPATLRRIAELFGARDGGSDRAVRRLVERAIGGRFPRGAVLARRRPHAAVAPQPAQAGRAPSAARPTQPRIVSIAWLEGTTEAGDVTQWVNLSADQAATYLRHLTSGTGPRSASRMGDLPRARIRFDREGRHDAEVWIEAHPDNVAYEGPEPGRNAKFPLDETHLDFTTDAPGTKDVQPFRIPPAGLNRYRLSARDSYGSPVVHSGWLTARRLLWIAPVHMRGKAVPDLGVVQSSQAQLGTDVVLLDAREVPYTRVLAVELGAGPPVPEPAYRATLEAVERAVAVPELGNLVRGVCRVDHIADFTVQHVQATVDPGTQSIRIELVPIGRLAHPLLWRGMATGADGRPADDWLVSATRVTGHHAPVDIEPSRVTPVLRTTSGPTDEPTADEQASAIEVNLRGITLTGSTRIRLQVKVFKMLYAGTATRNASVLADRRVYVPIPDGSVAIAAAHEVGHMVYAVAGPRGAGGPNPSNVEPPQFHYFNDGGHCRNPLPPRVPRGMPADFLGSMVPAPSRDARQVMWGGYYDVVLELRTAARGGAASTSPQPVCLMFGVVTPGHASAFCPFCVRAQRKVDLSEGYHR